MKRVPELDGLRGLAVLLVLAAHYFGEPPHGLVALTWGWIGVGLFFVLSGFLIGSIILDERDNPGFILSFYKRRAARILPAYCLTITFVLAAVALLAGRTWVDHPLPWPVYATFTQNFAVAGSLGGGVWLLPTWTLAVEEQFYLLIPLLILIIPTRRLLTALLVLWVCAICFRMAVYDGNQLAALTLLPSRADLLLSGVIAALVNRRYELHRRILLLRLTPLVAAVCLLGISVLDTGRTLTIFSPAILGMGGAALILSLVHGAPEGAGLRSPALRHIGRISYTLYLIHQPISGLLHGLLLGSRPDIATPAQWAVSLVAVAVSLSLAQLSWRFVEEPILRMAKGRRSERASPVVSVGAGATN